MAARIQPQWRLGRRWRQQPRRCGHGTPAGTGAASCPAGAGQPPAPSPHHQLLHRQHPAARVRPEKGRGDLLCRRGRRKRRRRQRRRRCGRCGQRRRCGWRRSAPGVCPGAPAESALYAGCRRTSARRRRRVSGRRGRRLQGSLAAQRRQERERPQRPSGRGAPGPRLGRRRPVLELRLGQLAGQRHSGRAAHALAGVGLLHALLGPAFFR